VKKHLLTTCLLGGLLSHSVLHAQAPDQKPDSPQKPKNPAAAPADTAALPEVLVEGRAEDLLGIATTASEGAIGSADLKDLPLLRRGELLETVPGMVVTQHSGDGKANQYFLRGFNLDHGTDFSFSVDGVPVNLPSHAHGQGYSDLNFLIPELIDTIGYKKGPFYSEVGDFSGAGSAQISLVNSLPHGIFTVESGMYDYVRVLFANSSKLGAGTLLYAFEYNHYDGPWTNAEKSSRYNFFVRYHQEVGDDKLSITASAYKAPGWNSTDQIPQRAVDSGLLSRYGAVDSTDGGRTSRYELSLDWTHRGDNATTKLSLYGFYYDLNLFSNFTYYLTDPVHGDQINQVDRRFVTGGELKQTWDQEWWGKKVRNTIGLQLRNDFIPTSGLNHTEDQQVLDVLVKDRIEEFSTGLFFANQIQWAKWFKSNLSVRGDLYSVDVNSVQAGNSGTKTAAIFSPKLSLVFGPWAKTEIYANIGSGFHSNDARGTTLSYDSSNVAQSKVPLLVRSEGAEIGVRTSAIEGLVSTVSLYYLHLDSELTFDGDSGDTQANGPSRRYGIEFANFYKPTPWLTLNADLALTNSRYTSPTTTVTGTQGYYIANSIPVVLSAGATVELPNGIFGNLRARYFGSQPLIEDNSVRQPASVIMDAKVGYRHRNWEVALEALNLLNSQSSDIAYYYTSRLKGESSSGVTGVVVHPAEPFEIRASFTLHF
jgi:outer membrane receptor protein involved in Fe transport